MNIELRTDLEDLRSAIERILDGNCMEQNPCVYRTSFDKVTFNKTTIGKHVKTLRNLLDGYSVYLIR